MARFELNGVIYEANEKGNYFYKSTGLNDKNGNPIMKRVSRAIYEQAFDEYVEQEQATMDTELEEAKKQVKAEQAQADKQTEDNFNKKYEKKQSGEKKARKSKDVAFQLQDITLTAKQVAFIREVQNSTFYENGVESTLWVDVLVDEIGGEFAGKPMTIGAMISTLKEKELVYVAVEKVNGKKGKYFGFTELGQMVVEELG